MAGFVAAASLLILVGVASPTTNVQASLIRVKQNVVKTRIHHEASVAGCPEMDNPGGRLSWLPQSDAGPWATGGTVALPTLGVQAPVVKVGVDQSGMMVVPHNARDVAWLDQGPLQSDGGSSRAVLGQTNNVVLAGHINYSGVMGSFGRIQSLRPGDRVSLRMDGKIWTFEIRWTCLFDFNTDQASRIMGYTEKPSVTLISCGGVWDPSAGTHNKRVAVRGDLVSSA